MPRIPVIPVSGAEVSASPSDGKRIVAESVDLKVTGSTTAVTLAPGEETTVTENVLIETAVPAKGYALVSPVELLQVDGKIKTLEAIVIAAGLARG